MWSRSSAAIGASLGPHQPSHFGIREDRSLVPLQPRGGMRGDGANLELGSSHHGETARRGAFAPTRHTRQRGTARPRFSRHEQVGLFATGGRKPTGARWHVRWAEGAVAQASALRLAQDSTDTRFRPEASLSSSSWSCASGELSVLQRRAENMRRVHAETAALREARRRGRAWDGGELAVAKAVMLRSSNYSPASVTKAAAAAAAAAHKQ